MFIIELNLTLQIIKGSDIMPTTIIFWTSLSLIYLHNLVAVCLKNTILIFSKSVLTILIIDYLLLNNLLKNPFLLFGFSLFKSL